ncbi:clp protease proteolytic subunit /Translocation-enhancing protein TepA [Artemisia annua]|uniref:Clp protease proteolytic subunit /Translocation-enhancing protein TepA n=1 Tax=Artemisia annua TaxID=35608 RepID=A0A2U1NLA0_ARTAN|nr:clp protease proteolytic subunit /Translocation-enhancing protein TepA [Artemisia annua]
MLLLSSNPSLSHNVLAVHVRGMDIETNGILLGRLLLVDLVGSERVAKSEVTGDILKEARHINRSLSALGNVHKDLSRTKRFNAQEALDYGLVDRIVRPPRIKADAPRKEAGRGLGRASWLGVGNSKRASFVWASWAQYNSATTAVSSRWYDIVFPVTSSTEVGAEVTDKTERMNERESKLTPARRFFPVTSSTEVGAEVTE